ncbi:MAG: VanZ family protein [Oscillospiraceae bacterium]|nr:VanZ family protein [Oscillospiraceae bacterium]
MYEFIAYVLSIFRDSLALVLIAGALFAVVVTAAYCIHKRKFHGEKKFPWGKAVLWLAFAGYVMIVLYATLMRMSGYHMQYNLHLFKAWREAWNNYSVKNIANVLLNVAMFVPLGFLLPLLWKLCRKWYVAIPSGFGFSLAIELIQLLTRRGVCDVDDLFCNTLGAVIGYFLIMAVMAIFVEKKWKPALIYGSLSLTCVLSICSIFVIYNTQEYGNLPIAPSYTIDMSDVKWTLDCQLPETAAEAPVYQTRRRTLQDCDVFAEEFRKIIPTEYNTISYYEEAAYYMDNGSDGGAHFLYVYYADQSYSYDALYDNEVPWLDADRKTIEAALEKYPVQIPDCAEFMQDGEGWHSFRVDQYIDGAVMFDGLLRVRYAEDGSVRNIENNLLPYTYHDDVKIISSSEAYQRLCAGKFNDGGRLEYEAPKEITVINCTLQYQIDTKGFYQPVYSFEVVSEDGQYQYWIQIPAMK